MRLSWAVSRINRIKVKEEEVEEDSSVDGDGDMGSLLFDVRSR